MPAVVATGRKPDVFACGFCHRADGPGGPENASLAGLSADYIKQQMADFKNGLGKTSVPERAPPQLMIALARAATDQEVRAAAEYFAALKPRATIRVVETDTVPKTYVAGWFLADAKTGEREPIGNRIIEIPEDLAQFENRDARSRFIAYVPVGSIQKGKELVAKGVGGGGTQCAGCHGPGLAGVGGIPAIAGRSPSYAVRQMYDFKSGARRQRQRIDEAGRGKNNAGRYGRARGLCGFIAAGRRVSEQMMPAPHGVAVRRLRWARRQMYVNRMS